MDDLKKQMERRWLERGVAQPVLKTRWRRPLGELVPVRRSAEMERLTLKREHALPRRWR